MSGHIPCSVSCLAQKCQMAQGMLQKQRQLSQSSIYILSTQGEARCNRKQIKRHVPSLYILQPQAYQQSILKAWPLKAIRGKKCLPLRPRGGSGPLVWQGKMRTYFLSVFNGGLCTCRVNVPAKITKEYLYDNSFSLSCCGERDFQGNFFYGSASQANLFYLFLHTS